MAPLPRPSPDEKTPENSKPVISTTSAIPCNSLLPSVMRRLHLPFSPSLPKPSRPGQVHSQPQHFDAASIHAHLVSAADRFIRALGAAASENQLLKSILSLPANFQRFCQAQCRNPDSLVTRDQNSLSTHNFAAILPGDSVTGLVVANGITNFLNIYNTLLVVRLVLTWFPGVPPAIVSPLSTLCDPYLNIFRGIIPPLGGTLDLSPILAFLVLNAFTSTAAALPAELPASRTCQDEPPPSHWMPLNLTTIQQKWMRRTCHRQNKTPKVEN